MIRRMLIALLRVYQVWISPLFAPCCRFYPSCSSYAIAALEKYGVWRGLPRAGIRLLKCQPLHPGGYDPVK